MKNLKSLHNSILKMLQTHKDEAGETEFKSTMLDESEIDALLEAISEFQRESGNKKVEQRFKKFETILLDGSVSVDDLDDEIKFWKSLSLTESKK